MDFAIKFAALLVLLLNASIISYVHGKDDYEHCKSIVQRWASSSLDLEVREDKHTLKDLLFFLHIPRTGGRSYFYCFLRKLYASSLECPLSYDKLRLDPSKPKCRLLVTHDDYSMMSKLHKEQTSVMTILRNPIDRVFSTYEFSIEVAARFLVHPNLTSAMGMSGLLRPKGNGVSTLDIWPWKYLVPWMREDLFTRRETRRLKDPTYDMDTDPYNMRDVVMPLHEYIHDPIARDIIHNGATFQIAGLTNNSYAPESHEIRHCVLKHHTLGEYVLRVAKKRLDDMLYVGLTEDHKESATMFATIVGSQVISQSIPSSHNTEVAVAETSDESSLSLVSESDINTHKNGSTNKKPNKVPSENIKETSKNMTVGKLMKYYEACAKGLRSSQAIRRVTSFKHISPANSTKETRRRVPEVILQQIRSLNSLDIELYAYAKDIYLKKHQQMMRKLYVGETRKNLSGDVYGTPSRNILWLTFRFYKTSVITSSLTYMFT